MGLIGKHNIKNANFNKLFVVFPVGGDCRYIRDTLGFEPIRNVTNHQYFILTYKDVINLKPLTNSSSLIGEVSDIWLNKEDIKKIIKSSTRAEITKRLLVRWDL